MDLSHHDTHSGHAGTDGRKRSGPLDALHAAARIAARQASSTILALFAALLLMPGLAAHAATLTVPLNTPTTIDLKPFIPGTGVTGVAISTDAAHGITEVNGTKVTYSPKLNYFGADSFSYVAFVGGVKTPPALVARLNASVVKALQDPGLRTRLSDQGAEATGNSVEQFSEFIRSEIARWAKVVKAAGATVD